MSLQVKNCIEDPRRKKDMHVYNKAMKVNESVIFYIFIKRGQKMKDKKGKEVGKKDS